MNSCELCGTETTGLSVCASCGVMNSEEEELSRFLLLMALVFVCVAIVVGGAALYFGGLIAAWLGFL